MLRGGGVDRDHRQLSGEFAEELSAHPTGRAASTQRDRNRLPFLLAGRDRRHTGGAFGTDAHARRGVFHIAALKYLAADGADRRSDRKSAVWRVGSPPSVEGRVDQFGKLRRGWLGCGQFGFRPRDVGQTGDSNMLGQA